METQPGRHNLGLHSVGIHRTHIVPDDATTLGFDSIDLGDSVWCGSGARCFYTNKSSTANRR